MNERIPGNFRTPVAAAMLSGVMCSVISLLSQPLWQIIVKTYPSPSLIRTVSILISGLVSAAYLSGPAISERNPQKAVRAFRRGFALSALIMLAWWGITQVFVIRWSPTGNNYAFIAVQEVEVSIYALFLSRALCRLYDLRKAPRSVYVAAILGRVAASIAHTVFFTAQQTGSAPGGMDTQDLDVVSVMSSLILNVMSVTLPTIFIERALRFQAVSDEAAHAAQNSAVAGLDPAPQEA